jgi:hypothetical protein
MILDVENFYGISSATVPQRFVLHGSTGYNIVGAYGRYGSTTSYGMLLQSYDAQVPYFMLQVTGSNPIYCGAAFYPIISQGTTTLALFQLRQSNTVHLNVFLGTDGSVRVLNGNGTQVGSTYTIPTYTLNTWYYFEVGAIIDNTSGSVEVRLGEKTIISASGVDTNNGITGSVFVDRVGSYVYGGFATPLQVYQTTDWYIVNSVGQRQATNTFLGDIRIISQPPTASGDSTQFLPLSSTNVSNVDDGISPDSDTTYVSASQADAMDLYRNAPYTGSVTTIYGVNIKAHVRKADAGSRGITTAIKSGSTLFYGPTSSLSDTYLYFSDTYELNPNTSSSWANLSEVNGTQFGVKIVS